MVSVASWLDVDGEDDEEDSVLDEITRAVVEPVRKWFQVAFRDNLSMEAASGMGLGVMYGGPLVVGLHAAVQAARGRGADFSPKVIDFVLYIVFDFLLLPLSRSMLLVTACGFFGRDGCWEDQKTAWSRVFAFAFFASYIPSGWCLNELEHGL